MNTNHYQTYRCSGCANTFLANQALPHRGGTATCTEEARCEDCNWRYGATDPENHSYTWKAADGQYWQECERCGAVTAKQALPALTIAQFGQGLPHAGLYVHLRGAGGLHAAGGAAMSFR